MDFFKFGVLEVEGFSPGGGELYDDAGFFAAGQDLLDASKAQGGVANELATGES